MEMYSNRVQTGVLITHGVRVNLRERRGLMTLMTVAILHLAHGQARNITTFAGTGVEGNSGDGGPATSAQLRFPMGIMPVAAGGAAPTGSVVIADSYNNELRLVSSNGERRIGFVLVLERAMEWHHNAQLYTLSRGA